MPVYEYDCPCGKQFDRYLPVARYLDEQKCECGQVAQKVIRTPPTGYVQRDVCYDSPIDGRPITSMAARREDMARAGCIEYDPGMHTDYTRRVAESERKLEESVDALLEKEVEAMPSRKRELLAAELECGATAEIVRQTKDD